MECFHIDDRITPNKGRGGAVQVFMRQCVTESSLGITQHRDTDSQTPSLHLALDVFFLEVPVGKVAHPAQGAHEEGGPKERWRFPFDQPECVGDDG